MVAESAERARPSYPGKIKVCVGGYQHFDAPIKPILDYMLKKGQDKEATAPDIIHNREVEEIRVSQVDQQPTSSDKLSFSYKDCSGIVVRGIDKETHEPLSLAYHISHYTLISDEIMKQEEFRKAVEDQRLGKRPLRNGETLEKKWGENQKKFDADLAAIQNTLERFRDRVEPSSLDCLVFGSNLPAGNASGFLPSHAAKYSAIVKKWSSIVGEGLHIPPQSLQVIGPQNAAKTLYFENGSGRAHILTSAKDDEPDPLPLRVFKASDVETVVRELIAAQSQPTH